ncbi:MAG TPA: hypothetical protein VGL72_29255 [Bryobacteraceae bacterium]
MSRLVVLLLTASTAFAQWKSIGPDGGSAHVLAIDQQDPRHLLAGSRTLLLYSSEDAGASWHPLPEFAGVVELYHTALNVALIDPADSKTYYAGISESNGRAEAQNGAGLYKSLDAGKTWTRVPSLAGISVYCLAFWEKDRHVMVAGTGRGVYRSGDSGETWERISPVENYELQVVMSIAIDPRNSSVIFAGTTHLPWKTADGGKTWHSIHAGMSDDSDVFSIRVDQRNSQRVYASACSGIYGSSSSGETWAKLPGIPFDNRRTHVITQDPKHPATLYAATTLGLWKSSAGGVGWRKTMPDSINAMVLDAQGVMYLAVEQRGLLKSTDGGETFTEINHGYINRNVTTIQAAGGAQHPYLYASTVYDGKWGGLFRTEDATGKWELLANEDMLHGRNLTSFAVLSGSGHMVAASYDGFLRSNDDGRTWSDMQSRKAPDIVAAPPKPGAKGKGPARPPIVRTTVKSEVLNFPSPKIHINDLKGSSGSNAYLVAATSAGLFKSNNGDEWKPIPVVPKLNLTVSAVFVSPGDTGGLAAVTAGGLFFSHDGGATWPVSAALPSRPDKVYEIAFDYQDPNLMIAATSDGIYQSKDGGRTWEFHYGGMSKGEVTSVIFHPLRHAEAYALNYLGEVYRSVDGGSHWQKFDRAGLGNVTFRTIAFDLSNTEPRLYGLAPLRGVFVYQESAPKAPENVTPHPHSAAN